MNKTALVIMAAGMGSRYGGGIKQLEHVGTSGEIIMEYSIYDALKAGFDKIVFITRRDLYDEFKKIIKPAIAERAEVEYVFQEIDNVPDGFKIPDGRTKPWGTGHAILSCLGKVKEPFAVINADDYYGSEAFKVLHDKLANVDVNARPMNFSMVGFVLGNTLSENGKVTRGACEVSADGKLLSVHERFEIYKDGNVAKAKDAEGNPIEIALDAPVSMNMWGCTPDFLKELQTGFAEFLNGIGGNELKAEYLLPEIIGKMVTEGKASVDVLKSNDKWFGVTYKEDKPFVVESFQKLYEQGVYPKTLF
jgi:hypothetical protein